MLKLFPKIETDEEGNVKNLAVRQHYATLVSVGGIAANLLISGGKFLVGFVFGNVAITADAVNNLSDAGTSIVALISARLSTKPADKEHPFGHARIEYIASLVVGFIIMLLSFELARTSIEHIISPSAIEFSMISVAVLLISIGVKVAMYFINKNLGEKLDAPVMIATATDSLSDVLATSAVLLSLIIGHLFNIQLDGYMGMIVALFILFAGISLLRDMFNKLIGTASNPDLVDKIEEFVCSYDGVIGTHDLIVHDYGYGRTFASIHAEVDAKEDIVVSHDLIDNIEREFEETFNIHLVIHMDPIVLNDPNTEIMKKKIEQLIANIDDTLQVHDFRLVEGPTHTNIVFDLSVPSPYPVHHDDLLDQIKEKVRQMPGNFYAVVTINAKYTA